MPDETVLKYCETSYTIDPNKTMDEEQLAPAAGFTLEEGEVVREGTQLAHEQQLEEIEEVRKAREEAEPLDLKAGANRPRGMEGYDRSSQTQDDHSLGSSETEQQERDEREQAQQPESDTQEHETIASSEKLEDGVDPTQPSSDPVNPSSEPQPSPAAPEGSSEDDCEPPDGSAREVLDWVGDDSGRAAMALERERAGQNRSRLIADLEKV